MVKDFDSRPWSDWKMLLATRLLMNRFCRSTELSREAHLEPICLHKQKYQFESGKRYINSCLRRNVISSWSCWVFLYGTIVSHVAAMHYMVYPTRLGGFDCFPKNGHRLIGRGFDSHSQVILR